MSQFYQIDSTKISLREYWWWSNSPSVIIGWLSKWLHARVPCSSDDVNTESILPFVSAELPPEVQQLFEPMAERLGQLGFIEPVYHIIYDAGSVTTWFWATYRQESGQYLARIHHRVWAKTGKRKPVLFPLFITPYADGTFLVSSSGKPDMAAPDSVEMLRKPGTDLDALWQAHQQVAVASGKGVYPGSSQQDTISVCEELHILLRDFHLARGVFKVRSEAEAAKATKIEAAKAIRYDNPEVMVELARLQEKKTSKQMVLWLLVGSLAGFLALGAKNWDWKFTLWLIPVLLFHEAGHWITMRIFKYRNLRMFFIPMFGAAVMGQHWNVPGWKKALVSLAGPLPGIIAGLALGIASILLHNPWMNKAALMLLLLNGMNLLPILPMDGGHVLQNTIFCRNRWLEAVFKLLAIGVLLLVGVGARAFLYVAIALGVSLPITFKLVKIKEELSKIDLAQPAPGEDRIPESTAQVIIRAIKDAFGPKMRLSDKNVAQYCLTVFENLNAKPPGVLATLGLLALQGGGLFIAIVMSLILVFSGRTDWQDFARAAVRQPTHSVKCSNVQQWGTGLVRPGHLIVTTFNKEDKAAGAFTELTNQIPRDCALTLFGQTVILSVPAGDEALREKWFDAMQARSTNLFVSVSNTPISFSMTFLAPDKRAASNVTEEVQAYLHATGAMHLVAPWSPDACRSNYPKFRKAREDWQRIGAGMGITYKDKDFVAFNAKLTAALKRGAMAEVKRLNQEQEEKMKEQRAQALEKFTEGADTTRVELAKLYKTLEELSFTNRVERQQTYRQLAGKLGEVQYAGDKPEPASNAYGASSGTISMHGLLCELRWANFVEPMGIVSLTRWLCDKGCLGFKYQLQGGWLNSDDPGDDPEGQ